MFRGLWLTSYSCIVVFLTKCWKLFQRVFNVCPNKKYVRLQLLVSKSITYAEYLKYQAKTCKSFIRDISDILLKLKSLSIVLSVSMLVTMASIFNNSLTISLTHKYWSPGGWCYKKVETRKKNCSIKHFEELHSINF